MCSWFPLCDTRRRDDDHLSLVAGISRNQRKALVGRGVDTVADLAKLALPPKPKIERIGDAALLRIREQARLQVQGREEGRAHLRVDRRRGRRQGSRHIAFSRRRQMCSLTLKRIPTFSTKAWNTSSAWLTLQRIRATSRSTNHSGRFNRSEEKKAFESFIAKVMERWRREPGDAHLPLRPLRADCHKAAGRTARHVRR